MTRAIRIRLAAPVAALLALAGVAGAEPAAEARPPDLLDLVLLEAPAPAGLVAYEAILKPGLDAEVELELVTPAARSFEGAPRRSRHRLRPGDPQRRLRVHAAPGERVRVRLSVLDPEGRAWLVIEKEQTVAGALEPAGPERVPVVRSRPDGRRIVEYMDRAEAERRGLVRDATPRATPDASPAPAPDTDAGGDTAPERILE